MYITGLILMWQPSVLATALANPTVSAKMMWMVAQIDQSKLWGNRCTNIKLWNVKSYNITKVVCGLLLFNYLKTRWWTNFLFSHPEQMMAVKYQRTERTRGRRRSRHCERCPASYTTLAFCFALWLFPWHALWHVVSQTSFSKGE